MSQLCHFFVSKLHFVIFQFFIFLSFHLQFSHFFYFTSFIFIIFIRSIAHPCFGSLSPSGPMTAEEWWMELVRRTFKGTETLANCLDEKEIEKILPFAFNFLYNKVFSTKEGWVAKEDSLYTLIKLREWRDQGAGPKIGVIANYDSRLHSILEGANFFFCLHLLFTYFYFLSFILHHFILILYRFRIIFYCNNQFCLST